MRDSPFAVLIIIINYYYSHLPVIPLTSYHTAHVIPYWVFACLRMCSRLSSLLQFSVVYRFMFILYLPIIIIIITCFLKCGRSYIFWTKIPSKLFQANGFPKTNALGQIVKRNDTLQISRIRFHSILIFNWFKARALLTDIGKS